MGDAAAVADDGDQARAPGTPVFETEAVTKQFGELVAVDQVDIAIDPGEFRSIIGPNGAGKTTLFNLATGTMSPTDGRIRFRGDDITDLRPHERVRRGIGRSFQITNVFGGLTVQENVRQAVQATRMADMSLLDRFTRNRSTFEAILDRTDDVLRRIDLLGHADESAAALAYGDRRRLEIGLVLATDPELVLLDEPTSGMSADETAETIRLIDDVLADRTLIIIEHDIDVVMDISDRVTVLDRGRELATGTPAEISANEHVQEAYLGNSYS
ncbi:MAG: ABC transporter ATP-binding protein [Halobacteriales archaeon]